jgi:hypothetical protein
VASGAPARGVRSSEGAHTLCYSDGTIANRNVRGEWEIAHEAAVSRHPPISLDTIVARTRGYTYDATVWDLSLVQGPFSVAPVRAKP